MKKLRKFLSASRANVVIFVLAAALVVSASIGGARAAVAYIAQTYGTSVRMYDIGVSLLENGERVSWRDYDSTKGDGTWDAKVGDSDKNSLDVPLLTHMLDEGEKFTLGKTYSEELAVKNSGTINQYVRVSIYRYWIDPNKKVDPSIKGDTNKRQDLMPEYIDLRLTNLGTYWIEDESARTSERTVLYYNRLLNVEDTTPLFADALTISSEIAKKIETVQMPDGTIRNIYTYDGAQFVIEVAVDAVQENNAEDAILSAWGRHVLVDEDAGTLALR